MRHLGDAGGPDDRVERHDHDDGPTDGALPDDQTHPPQAGGGPSGPRRRELDELFADREPALRPVVGDDAVQRLLLSEVFSARRDGGRRDTVATTDRTAVPSVPQGVGGVSAAGAGGVSGPRGHPAGRDGPGTAAGMA